MYCWIYQINLSSCIVEDRLESALCKQIWKSLWKYTDYCSRWMFIWINNPQWCAWPYKQNKMPLKLIRMCESETSFLFLQCSWLCVKQLLPYPLLFKNCHRKSDSGRNAWSNDTYIHKKVTCFFNTKSNQNLTMMVPKSFHLSICTESVMCLLVMLATCLFLSHWLHTYFRSDFFPIVYCSSSKDYLDELQ